MMENFFETCFAERLLAEFPRFDPKLAGDEMGNTGGKAVNTKIREISPAYSELYEMIGSAEFLGLISRISGVPDLQIDPKLYGGGTHENLQGQELDPHVDFNYDEAQQLHRRLNLIVYLNKEWKTEWGGAIEIHSNPWDHERNQVKTFDPLFNRCVMFETNEHSWHGFPKINLPADQFEEDKRQLSRKSISIYLYTKDRPAEEIAPMHGTFYAQRPLPAHIREGYTLIGEDVSGLKRLLARRDGWLRKYQQMESAKNREIASKTRTIDELLDRIRVPLTGYVLLRGASGIYPDLWATSRSQIEIQPLAAVAGLLLRGSRPEGAGPARIKLSAAGVTAETPIGGGSFKVPITFPRALREPFTLIIETETQGRTVGDDSRDLVFILAELRAKHPLAQMFKKMLS